MFPRNSNLTELLLRTHDVHTKTRISTDFRWHPPRAFAVDTHAERTYFHNLQHAQLRGCWASCPFS